MGTSINRSWVPFNICIGNSFVSQTPIPSRLDSRSSATVISIPLKGYLKHGDSVQNTKTITPGDIQVMSTGSGIYHSEYNGSDKEQLEFLQIWVFPRVENTKPEYNNFDIRLFFPYRNFP